MGGRAGEACLGMSVRRAPVCVERSDSHSRAAVLCWREGCRWCAQMSPCCVCRCRWRTRFTRRRGWPARPVLDVRGVRAVALVVHAVGVGSPCTWVPELQARGAGRPSWGAAVHAGFAARACGSGSRVCGAGARTRGGGGPRVRRRWRTRVVGRPGPVRGAACVFRAWERVRGTRTPEPGAFRAGGGRFVAYSGRGLKKGQPFRPRQGPGRRATPVIPRV
jgi:hypothetical protein